WPVRASPPPSREQPVAPQPTLFPLLRNPPWGLTRPARAALRPGVRSFPIRDLATRPDALAPRRGETADMEIACPHCGAENFTIPGWADRDRCSRCGRQLAQGELKSTGEDWARRYVRRFRRRTQRKPSSLTML